MKNNPDNYSNLSINTQSILMEHLPYGYALHKIITDKDNTPVDYVFVEANALFESYTGLKKKDIIGHKITDVIPDIKKDKFDWISFYGDIALNNKKERLEQFSEAINKWFSISVFSPEKDYFITFLEDISQIKNQAIEYKKRGDEYYSLNEELRSLMEQLEDQNNLLSDREELNRLILDSTADGILVINNDGEVSHVNDKFHQIWNVPEDLKNEIKDEKLLQYVSDQIKNPEEFLSKVEQLYKSTDVDSDTIYLKLGKTFERYTSPIIREGIISGRLWCFRDITERNEAKLRLENLNAVLRGIRDVNRLQYIGLSKEEFLNNVCSSMVNNLSYQSIMIVLKNEEKLYLAASAGLSNRDLNDVDNYIVENKTFPCIKMLSAKKRIHIIIDPQTRCFGCPIANTNHKNESSFIVSLEYNKKHYGYIIIAVPIKFSNDIESLELFQELANDISVSLSQKELEEINIKSIEEIKRNKDRLVSIFAAAPIGIGVVVNRNITEINQKFCDITGYKKEDLIGKSAIVLYPSEYEYNKVGKEKYDQIKEKGTGTVETKMKRKDGKIIDVLLSSTPIDQNDLNKGVTFTALDISKSKRNAKVKDILLAINQESDKTRNIEQLAPKIQFELSKIFNTKNFYIALYNYKNKMYSFPYFDDEFEKEDDYINKSYKLENSLTDYVRKEKKASLINPENEKELYESGLVKKFGTYSPVWMGAPLINSKGLCYGVIAVQHYKDEKAYNTDDLSILDYVAKNISKLIEKIQAENKLKESEEKFRLSFKTSPDAVTINRLSDGMYLEINEGSTKLTGYTAKDVKDKTSNQLNIWDDPQDRAELVKELLDKGKVTNFEFKARTKKGKIKYALMSANIISIEDEKCILSVTRDISIRKKFEMELYEKNSELQATEEELTASNNELHWLNNELEKNNKELIIAKERAESADKLKSAFLANMSHEIRTPMNSILGFSQLLRKDTLPAERKNYFIDIINTNGRQLLAIINDIIDISKIEANQIELFETNVDINTLLDELYLTYNNEIKIQKKEIKLNLVKPIKKEFFILTDEIRLRQVFANLLSNAIKFTHTGEIEYGVELYKKDQLLFFVKDTGIGIASDKLEIVFDRFRQEDGSSTREFGGTGLGLAISLGFIKLMGGKIWVESIKDIGSQFYFTIPLKNVVDEKTIYIPEQKVENPDWSDKTILIVEDDSSSFELLESAFFETKVNVIHAICGKDALKAFNETINIDLILMDIQLPDIDGLKLTKQIRKTNTKIPIIAQTAFAMSEDKNECIKAGCNDYIAKPIMIDALFEKLNYYLK